MSKRTRCGFCERGMHRGRVCVYCNGTGDAPMSKFDDPGEPQFRVVSSSEPTSEPTSSPSSSAQSSEE